MKWVNYQPLCHFVRVYHAPYISKYRYWSGLLLFTRIALYLVFALNVSGDPGVNLLAINISVISLLILKAYLGQIYEKSFIDLTEISCYANLGIFSTVKLNFQDGKTVTIAAHISGTFTVVLLVVIISYHSLYLILNSKCSKRCVNVTESQFHGNDDRKVTAVSSPTSKESYPTYSIVDIGELIDSERQGSLNINQNDKVSKLASDVDDDGASETTDSTSPLLNEHD